MSDTTNDATNVTSNSTDSVVSTQDVSATFQSTVAIQDTVTVPDNIVADGSVTPVQDNESLNSIAERQIVDFNGPMIRYSPIFQSMIEDTKKQITDNRIATGG